MLPDVNVTPHYTSRMLNFPSFPSHDILYEFIVGLFMILHNVAVYQKINQRSVISLLHFTTVCKRKASENRMRVKAKTFYADNSYSCICVYRD